MSQRVTILGATGSIGSSTLKVIAHAPKHYQVAALTAQDNVDALIALASEHRPSRVVIGNETHYPALKAALAGQGIALAAGVEALCEAATEDAEAVVAGIVGTAGLRPTFAALKPNRRLLLANKECLVSAGPLFMARAREMGTQLLPIDSEHNAVFQLLDPARMAAVESITLTASGGPFRTWDQARMASATPEQAVAHPTWKMGAKISVDSASMMNKALEMIEAHYLFGLPAEKIRAVIHPQSLVHSFVNYVDGSSLAHVGTTDMCVPIAHGLAWPERLPCPVPPLDPSTLSTLTFEPADAARFPALALAQEAMRKGPHACMVLNAANEVAVAAFLAGRIGFLDIVNIVAAQLADCLETPMPDLETVIALDEAARAKTESALREPVGGKRAAVL